MKKLITLLIFIAFVPAPVFAGQTSMQYAQMCTDMIGQIPVFDCTKGEVVPITVNGETPAEYNDHMTCDRPALLQYGKKTAGQCTPYSRLHDLSKGDTQISAFCRREFIRPESSPYYDEVDIVLHSQKSGDTCWFHAESKDSIKGFDASRVPPPNEKTPPANAVSAAKFWWTPAATAKKDCGGCHDADPFMFSPWIGQKWSFVPTDPLGKYHHLGSDFSKWQSSSISTRDNSCTGCHRIGNQESCRSFIGYASGLKLAPGGNQLANTYPLNHWMPAQNNQSEAFWNAVHQQSTQELLSCCSDPSNAMCAITPITSKK